MKIILSRLVKPLALTAVTAGPSGKPTSPPDQSSGPCRSTPPTAMWSATGSTTEVRGELSPPDGQRVCRSRPGRTARGSCCPGPGDRIVGTPSRQPDADPHCRVAHRREPVAQGHGLRVRLRDMAEQDVRCGAGCGVHLPGPFTPAAPSGLEQLAEPEQVGVQCRRGARTVGPQGIEQPLDTHVTIGVDAARPRSWPAADRRPAAQCRRTSTTVAQPRGDLSMEQVRRSVASSATILLAGQGRQGVRHSRGGAAPASEGPGCAVRRSWTSWGVRH